jgi:hypothetical protein
MTSAGWCEVLAAIPKSPNFHKTKRAPAPDREKFASNFYPDLQLASRKMWGSRKMWVIPLRIACSNRSESITMYIGNVRAGGDMGARHWARRIDSCSESAVNRVARSASHYFHSRGTNGAFCLADTGAPFVTLESCLTAASYSSGGAEAPLDGKALRSLLGKLSPWVRPRIRLSVRGARGHSVAPGRARKSSSHQNYRSGTTLAHRRGKSIRADGYRKV